MAKRSVAGTAPNCLAAGVLLGAGSATLAFPRHSESAVLAEAVAPYSGLHSRAVAVLSAPIIRHTLPVVLSCCLLGCATAPLSDTEDVCAIFIEQRTWYPAAKRSAKRWRIPVEVLMATMHQESRFEARARPPRGRRILGIFPGRRSSDAVGYAQALRSTWRMYRDSGKASWLSSRSCFNDAVDFVGWYHARSADRLKLSPRNAEHLYLAYHEGWGGYGRGSWKRSDKRWLRDVATKVQGRAEIYRSQLQGCDTLRRRWFFGLF